jgi:Ca-activated chloride channel family protein
MASKWLRVLALGLCAVASIPQRARGQGLIVDRRPHVPVMRSYEVREVALDARLRDQVAEVQVTQTFYNPGSFPLEAEYLFPIPDDGAVQNFVFLVDGREVPGRLLPKDEARRIYEDIVRHKRDPALLEYMGRGVFRTSVFPIPPGAERKVTLRYTQLCRRDRDVVEFSYPFGTQKFTSKPIERLALRIDLASKDAIKSIYSPSHEPEIRRSGDYEASIRLTQHHVVPTADFRLLYTLESGALGATVLSYRPNDSDDGYFLLLASPEVKAADTKPVPKSVIFVLDRSGSMTGKKIEQAKGALKFVLDNLRDDDTFNIIVYDDRVETFKPELQRYTSETRAQAARFVENIHPGGSTDINGALTTAMAMLHDDDRPQYVLFLTDGLPTAGVTGESAIAENARKANKTHARLFAFGVGYDVNARLIDRLTGGNSGTSEYVKPDEDIEVRVSRFYAKFTSPVLAGITIDMPDSDLNRTYPRDIPDLFAGTQLVWVGRYHRSGRTAVRINGKVGSERRTLEFSADLAESGRGRTYDFVEKLWAVRRVGFLIDQIDLHGESRELTEELVSLSTKYGILTPYTSFLADENVPIHSASLNYERARDSLRELETLSGAGGTAQRAQKGAYLNAPNAAQSNAPALAYTPAPPASAGGGYASTPHRASRSFEARGLGRERQPGQAPVQQGMGGMGAMGPMTKPAAPNVVAFKDAQGNDQVAATVRTQGKKTFYRRGDHWVDAEVKPADEAKAVVIEQFSDDYFKLARAQDAESNQYLTFEEPVTVNLEGKIYRIEPPKNSSR